jgi:hypothetical protein
VGNRAGVEFMETLKISQTFDDVLKMMTNESAPVKIPDRADARYALVSAMGYFLWRGKDAKEETKLMDGFYRICGKLSSDFASMAMMDAISGKEGTDPEKMDKMFAHPSYKAWEEKHGKELKKRISF